MAEFVELNLEEMLPELEQMQRVQLFQPDEIKAIIKKRREFEYKLQKRTKQKEDYLKYIQYEVTLLSLLRIRREKTGYQHKKPEMDYAIANRINKLFTYSIARFTSDLKLWLSHIEFLKRMKWNSSISRVFVRLLAVKSQNPSVWILAAKWEFEDNKSIANARALMLRALRFHPENTQIYAEAFRLELLEAERLRKRREVLGLSVEGDLPDKEEERDKILDGHLAILFYNDCKKIFKSTTDLVPFLIIAKSFNFTVDIQKAIINDMKIDFGHDEVTWDTIARACLEKDSLVADEQNGMNTLKGRVALCCTTYEEAIVKLGSQKMWQLYIETLMELYDNDAIRPKIQSRLNDVCGRALQAGQLDENQLLKWLDIVERNKWNAKEVRSILRKSVDRFQKNSTLWTKYVESLGCDDSDDLLFAIDTGGGNDIMSSDNKSGTPSRLPDEFLSEFWRGVACLGDTKESIVLWQSVIDRYDRLSDTITDYVQIVQTIYDKAVSGTVTVCSRLKPCYLQWIAQRKGLHEARRYYAKYCNLPPLLIKFHMHMVDCECQQSDLDVQAVRKILDTACSQFGSDDPEIWLAYIRFELERGGPDRVAHLHYRAKLTLSTGVVDQFLTQYTLMQLKG